MLVCPPWSADADEHRAPHFAEGVEGVLASARRKARVAIPTLIDIEDWHWLVFKDWVPLDYYAGNVRQDHSWMVCLGRDVAVGPARGTPFPVVPSATRELLSQARQRLRILDLRWSTLTDAERARDLATTIGVTIARFIQIHPFLNGNGRMSRFIWTVFLARFGITAGLSVVRRPSGPYESVMASAMRGDYAPAVVMVLDALSGAPRPEMAVPEKHESNG